MKEIITRDNTDKHSVSEVFDKQVYKMMSINEDDIVLDIG